ncbi:MAG: winged helix-turn-helix domain-containing protein [Myxococcota bacterium]
MDLETGAVRPDGGLRPMELRMLRYLAARTGEVVSQAELLEHVWQYSGNARTRTVYSTLHRLRLALEDDPTAPQFLETVAGQGIRLRASQAAAPSRPAAKVAHRASDRFVGRAEQLAALAEPQHRLLTILGPGGAGKTRLALEHLRAGPDAGWFCDLPEACTVARAAETAASTLGLALREPLSDLGPALALRGPCTLVLDNFESVEDDAGSFVVALLDQAPQAKLLITSRRRVGVAAERVLHLGPLSPPPGPDALEGEAVALFLDRILHGDPTFDAALHAADVVALIDALDGLPLAIEIAAAHAALIGPAEVLAALRARATLTSRRSDRPSRHASLDAMVAWSWERLPAEAQQALADLQVFRQPFDLAGATAVLGAPAHELVAELTERGLLQRRAGVPARFAPFHVVRRFVEAARAPDDAAVERYLAHMRQEAEQAYAATLLPRASSIDGPGNHDEIVAAGRLALARDPATAGCLVAYGLHQAAVGNRWQPGGELAALAEANLDRLDPVHRLYVADGLTLYRHVAGRAEAAFALRRQIPRDAEALGRSDLAAFYSGAAARTAATMGRVDVAVAALADMERHLAALGDAASPALVAVVDLARGSVLDLRGEPGAVEAFQRVVARFRAHAVEEGLAGARMDLGVILARRGRFEEAEVTLRALVDDCDAEGRPGMAAAALGRLGMVMARGRRPGAREVLDRAVEAVASHGLFSMVPQVRVARAQAALFDGDLATAEADAREVLSSARSLLDARSQCIATLVLAHAAHRRGSSAEAHALYVEAHDIGLRIDQGNCEIVTVALLQHHVAEGRLEAALAVAEAFLAQASPAHEARVRWFTAELRHQLGQGAPPGAPPAALGGWAPLLRARAHLREGAVDRAREGLSTCSQDPEDPLFNRVLAQLREVTQL